jgi:hypothetical protein
VFVGDAFNDGEDDGDLFDNFGDDDYIEEDRKTKSSSKNDKHLNKKKKRNIEYEYEKDEDEKLLH